MQKTYVVIASMLFCGLMNSVALGMDDASIIIAQQLRDMIIAVEHELPANRRNIIENAMLARDFGQVVLLLGIVHVFPPVIRGARPFMEGDEVGRRLFRLALNCLRDLFLTHAEVGIALMHPQGAHLLQGQEKRIRAVWHSLQPEVRAFLHDHGFSGDEGDRDDGGIIFLG